MDLSDYESRLNRPTLMKVPELQRNERLKHIIFAAQYTKDQLDHLCGLATMIRTIDKTREGAEFLRNLLHTKRAMLYFQQASTRTFLSFAAACQVLGMATNEIRDPRVSSEYKGESPFDSMRMFSSYFDVVIMRNATAGFAECCAYLMNDLDDAGERPVPIVNGGSGADEHPTQALLDIYTIQRAFEFRDKRDSSKRTRLSDLQKLYPTLQPGLGGKTYAFCGDIGRGRTVRSLVQLLSKYENVRMIFVSPNHPSLRLPESFEEMLVDRGVKVEFAETLDECLAEVDLLYMTRIQHEHDSDEDAAFFKNYDPTDYILTTERAAKMREHAAILHPFPRNEEIEAGVDQNHRAKYFQQARNGMWARAALLAYLFDADGRIASYYAKNFSGQPEYREGKQ